jgi:hypothetical protein
LRRGLSDCGETLSGCPRSAEDLTGGRITRLT